MKSLAFMAAMGSTLLNAPIAHAAEPQGFDDAGRRWYGSFAIGYNWPQTVNSHSTRPAPDGLPYDWQWQSKSDWSMNGSIGYRLTRHVRAEFEIGYQNSALNSVHAPGGSANGISILRPSEPYGLCATASVPPGCVSPGDAKNNWTWMFTSMANVIFDVLPDERIDPFVGVGAGFAHVQWPSLFAFSNVPGPITATNPASQVLKGAGTFATKDPYGIEALAGLSFHATPRVRLDVTYRYYFTPGNLRWNPANTTPGLSSADGLQPGDFLGRFQDHSITAGLRYAF